MLKLLSSPSSEETNNKLPEIIVMEFFIDKVQKENKMYSEIQFKWSSVATNIPTKIVNKYTWRIPNTKSRQYDWEKDINTNLSPNSYINYILDSMRNPYKYLWCSFKEDRKPTKGWRYIFSSCQSLNDKKPSRIYLWSWWSDCQIKEESLQKFSFCSGNRTNTRSTVSIWGTHLRPS